MCHFQRLRSVVCLHEKAKARVKRACGNCSLISMHLASEQKGEPSMEDLGDWAHHQRPDTVHLHGLSFACHCLILRWQPTDKVACNTNGCALSTSWWMTCCSARGMNPFRSCSAQTSKAMWLSSPLESSCDQFDRGDEHLSWHRQAQLNAMRNAV